MQVWVRSPNLPAYMFESESLYTCGGSVRLLAKCLYLYLLARPSAGAPGARLMRKHKTDTTQDIQQMLTVVVSLIASLWRIELFPNGSKSNCVSNMQFLFARRATRPMSSFCINS